MRLVLLGLPPTTNNLYTVVEGRQLTSAAGRSFHSAVTTVAQTISSQPSGDPFAVLVTYHLGAHDRDVDGSHKALIDGLSGVVWHDDRQIALFAARKRFLPPGSFPYVSVVIRRLARRPTFRFHRAPRDGVSFATELWPPSTNNTYTVSAGRRRKTAEARDLLARYRDGFEAIAGRAPRPLYGGPVRVRLRYGFVADRRDVDGSHKLLLDAARGVLWSDDRQIIRFSVAKARRTASASPIIEGALWPVASPSPARHARTAERRTRSVTTPVDAALVAGAA